jgi:hypothetical protein
MDSNEFYLNFKLNQFKNHVIKSREIFFEIFQLLKQILLCLETFEYQRIEGDNLINNLKTLILVFKHLKLLNYLLLKLKIHENLKILLIL